MRGSIQKKGNNYYIVYYVNRKQKWKAAGKNKKTAERMLADVVGQIYKGEYRELPSITFGEFAQKWLDEQARFRVTSGTLVNYKSLLNNHILPTFATKKLASIRFDDIQAFIAYEMDEGRLQPQTINLLLRPLNGIFKYAVRSGYLRENPAQYVETPKVIHPEMDFLTRDEVTLFLQHVPGRWYALFLTAVMTGMRRGELLAMRWGNLDWNRRQYFINETLSQRTGEFHEPKSEKSRRAVDLPPTLLKVLRQHRLRQNEEKLESGPKYHDEGLMFCQKNGKPFDAANLLKWVFFPVLKKAGIRRVRFHDPRHTYVSLLIAQGENPKYIQSQLGHASIKTTMDRYGHLMPETRQDAAKRLDEQLFGSPIRQQV